MAAAGNIRHPLAAQLEGGTGLRTFRDLEHLVAVEARHLDLAAERQCREGERHGAEQIVAIALEELVLADEDDDIEIARRTAKGSGFPFAGETKALARGNAGGDLHRQLAHLLHGAFAAAGGAGLGDHLAGAAALPARARHGKKSLLVPQLAGAAALRTCRRRRSGSGAVAVAGFAGFVPRNLDAGLGALR